MIAITNVYEPLCRFATMTFFLPLREESMLLFTVAAGLYYICKTSFRHFISVRPIKHEDHARIDQLRPTISFDGRRINESLRRAFSPFLRSILLKTNNRVI